MTKNQKILTGILSVLPLIFIAIGIISLVSSLIDQIPRDGSTFEDPEAFIRSILSGYVTIMFAVLLAFGVKIYFIILAVKDKSSGDDEKVLWVLLITFLSVVAYPIFWVVRIWNNHEFRTKEIGQDSA
jgi:hypothetical protein